MTEKIFLKIQRIIKTDIVKVFSLTSISTIVKMLTSFVAVKIVAVIIGAGGIAILGQLQNFISMVLSFASGGINSGVTKYISEYKDSPKKIRFFISTGFYITIIASLISGILLITTANYWSRLILLDTQYRFVFQLFGITIILYTLNSYFLSIINGYKEFKKFVTISIVTSLLGLIFTVVLVFLFELKGALISTVTYQSVVFFATILMVRKTKWFNKFNFFSKFSYLITKKYLHFSLMAFVTTATVPLSQLFIRSYAIKNISAEQAGWWEAMNRLSGMYLMIITASFGIYYLPRLAELKSKNELRKEIFSAYKIIIPLLLLGFTVIFIFKDLIIKLLFSVEFYPMRDLFFWQLIGDFFKITSWLLAFLMIAKSMTKEFIITEIGSSLLFVSLALFLVNRNGIIGITQAYFINYIIYAFTMSIMFRKTIFYNNRK